MASSRAPLLAAVFCTLGMCSRVGVHLDLDASVESQDLALTPEQQVAFMFLDPFDGFAASFAEETADLTEDTLAASEADDAAEDFVVAEDQPTGERDHWNGEYKMIAASGELNEGLVCAGVNSFMRSLVRSGSYGIGRVRQGLNITGNRLVVTDKGPAVMNRGGRKRTWILGGPEVEILSRGVKSMRKVYFDGDVLQFIVKLPDQTVLDSKATVQGDTYKIVGTCIPPKGHSPTYTHTFKRTSHRSP